MNVQKIQKLSKQHRELEDFHKMCNQTDVELAIKRFSPSFGDTTLESENVQLISVKIREALLEQMAILKEEIKKEATNG